jgi:UDP-glucose 4-epimerase
MKYLVTGNAGFIGSAVATALINKNHIVYGIDNLSTGFNKNINKKVKFIKGDFSDDKIIKKLNGLKFDAVLHIGGQSSGEISYENPEYDLQTNTLSTLKLLQLCLKNKCKKFIYASSMSVYGQSGNKEKFSEDDELNPRSFYAISKLASEKYLKLFSNQFGINYVSLRYFNVYGPGQNLENMKQGMVSIYLRQFLDDKIDKVVVKGDIKRFRDLIYIDDVVNITIQSLINNKFNNQIINVGTGKKITVAKILELIKKEIGYKKIEISKGTPGDQFGIYANNKKLKSLYRGSLLSFDEGLKKMIDWIKKK